MIFKLSLSSNLKIIFKNELLPAREITPVIEKTIYGPQTPTLKIRALAPQPTKLIKPLLNVYFSFYKRISK